MRNGFANFRKVGCEFRNAKFRNAKFRNGFDCETNEQCIGIVKLKLALRNWHCEIRIAKFRIANLEKLALRTAQYPAATVPLVLHSAACILLQLHLIFFTLPWFFF